MKTHRVIWGSVVRHTWWFSAPIYIDTYTYILHMHIHCSTCNLWEPYVLLYSPSAPSCFPPGSAGQLHLSTSWAKCRGAGAEQDGWLHIKIWGGINSLLLSHPHPEKAIFGKANWRRWCLTIAVLAPYGWMDAGAALSQPAFKQRKEKSQRSNAIRGGWYWIMHETQ